MTVAFPSKSFTKGKFEIVSTSEATLKHAISFLLDALMARVKFNATPNSTFEGISDHWLHALVMLMLGCDVYILCMKAVWGKSAMRNVQSEDRTSKDELFISLHQKFMEANRLLKEKLDTYIDAIVYIPINKAGEIDESVIVSIDSIARTYLFECPKNLPRYSDQYSIDASFKMNKILMDLQH